MIVLLDNILKGFIIDGRKERKLIELKIDLGGAIKHLREEKEMSQVDLRKASGLEVPYISKLENNIIRDPRIGTIFKLARAFKITITEFICVAENCRAGKNCPICGNKLN